MHLRVQTRISAKHYVVSIGLHRWYRGAVPRQGITAHSCPSLLSRSYNGSQSTPFLIGMPHIPTQCQTQHVMETLNTSQHTDESSPIDPEPPTLISPSPSNTTPEPPSTSLLLRLSPELRNQIYQHVYTSSVIKSQHRHPRPASLLQTNLRRVHRPDLRFRRVLRRRLGDSAAMAEATPTTQKEPDRRDLVWR